MNYNYCIRLWIKTIVITNIVLGIIIYYKSIQVYNYKSHYLEDNNSKSLNISIGKSESEIDINNNISNEQFSELLHYSHHRNEKGKTEKSKTKIETTGKVSSNLLKPEIQVIPVTKTESSIALQAANGQNNSESQDFHQLKQLLNKRFWSLKTNTSAAAANDNDRFFTKSRLLDIQKFSLFRPNSENIKSFFKNDDRMTALQVLGMEGLPKEWVLKPKRIYLPNSFLWWNLKDNGQNLATYGFHGNCASWKVNQCVLTESTENLQDIDLIISTAGRLNMQSTNEYRKLLGVKPQTTFLYYELESPYIEPLKIPLETANIDWLSSYWRGSDIATPYARWEYYDLNVTKKPQEKNYAKGKTKFGAIFMSNCYSRNGRIPFINKLQTMIQIDMYGQCGTFKCGRENHQQCFDKLREEYKFYFAFENANCREYITEKFFMNALLNDVIPVVFGARPDDYKLAAPANSYIHVEDFNTTDDLVKYLKYLDSNDTAYNSYFEWKGTGEFIDTKYFCRVCALLHYHDYLMENMEVRPNNNNNEVQASGKNRNNFQLTPITWNPLSKCSHGVFWKMKKFL